MHFVFGWCRTLRKAPNLWKVRSVESAGPSHGQWLTTHGGQGGSESMLTAAKATPGKVRREGGMGGERETATRRQTVRGLRGGAVRHPSFTPPFLCFCNTHAVRSGKIFPLYITIRLFFRLFTHPRRPSPPLQTLFRTCVVSRRRPLWWEAAADVSGSERNWTEKGRGDEKEKEKKKKQVRTHSHPIGQLFKVSGKHDRSTRWSVRQTNEVFHAGTCVLEILATAWVSKKYSSLHPPSVLLNLYFIVALVCVLKVFRVYTAFTSKSL